MARKRWVSPEMWTDPKINKVCRDVRLMFIGLITCANDYGKMRATPSIIRSKIFPEDDVPLDTIEDWLNQLAALNLIIRYNITGEPYIYVTAWGKHQPLQNPQKDEFPHPPKEALKNKSIPIQDRLKKSSEAHRNIYFFNNIYKEYIGVDYLINYGRDIKLMKDILKANGEEITQALIKEFFEWGEDQACWYHDKGRGVNMFKSQIDKLQMRLRK